MKKKIVTLSLLTIFIVKPAFASGGDGLSGMVAMGIAAVIFYFVVTALRSIRRRNK